MRKEITLYRFALAMLSVALCGGCAKTTTDEDTENLMPMRFGLSEISTRAAISGVSDLQQEGQAFSVWGTYARTSGNTTTGQTFTVFDGTPVTYKSTAWTYDNPQYWFPGFTYNFRALYPSSVQNVTFDGSALQINNFDGTQSIDLLAASPAPIPCRVNQTMGKVQLTFRHLLSRVAFIGKSDPTLLGDGRQIVIEEAVLSGVYKTGNWSGATFDANTSGTWTPTGAPQTYTVTDITLATDGTNLFSDELFIPQDLTNAELTIKFHYNVKNGTAKTFTSTTQLSTLLPKWEAGKSYRYPFTIGSHIFFTKPTIDKWVYAPINNTNDFNIYPTN